MTSIEQPYSGVAQFVESHNSLDIIIPAKKNWFVVAFLAFWMCGWLFGEISVITIIITGMIDGNILMMFFLLFWLVGWTAGGIFALRMLIWVTSGKEVITFTPGTITTSKKNLLFNKPKTYDLNSVKNIRVHEHQDSWGSYFQKKPLIPPGVIHFSYGMKTIKMGSGIDLPEAEQILKTVKSKGYLREQNFNAQ